METVQNAVAETVTELKDQQRNAFQAISDIRAGLEIVEGQTAILQRRQTDVKELHDEVNSFELEACALRHRLDDVEDQF